MDIKHLLKDHAYQGIPLGFDEAYALAQVAMASCNGKFPEDEREQARIQSIAALCALHNGHTYRWQRNGHAQYHDHSLPNNAAEQIAGVCAAVFEHDIAKSEFGWLDPDVEFVMDNCGMGGDLVTTPNVSTIAAFIAAAAGIPMCKHGSPSNTDKGQYGSSDFVGQICGIDPFAHRDRVAECVQRFKFGYTEALDTRYKLIHLQTHQIAELPHMNDIIGPITSPLHPQKHIRRVVGVNHLIPPEVVAEAYLIMNERGITNLHHGLFVRGFVDEARYRGMDEVSTCAGGTTVAELKDGQVRILELSASDFGLPKSSAEAITPVGNKGEFSLQILKGEVKGAPLDLILANAAILFYLAGRSNDLRECTAMAREVHASGAPYKTMLAVRDHCRP